MNNALKNIFATLLLMACLHVSAEEIVPDAIPGTTKISAEELISLAQEEADLVIIDSRKVSDHKDGYIEGSINLPDTETDPASLAKHIPGKGTPVIFYCNGIKCGRSVTSAKVAVAAGYRNIYWFRGGWAEWNEKGYPVVR